MYLDGYYKYSLVDPYHVERIMAAEPLFLRRCQTPRKRPRHHSNEDDDVSVKRQKISSVSIIELLPLDVLYEQLFRFLSPHDLLTFAMCSRSARDLVYGAERIWKHRCSEELGLRKKNRRGHWFEWYARHALRKRICCVCRLDGLNTVRRFRWHFPGQREYVHEKCSRQAITLRPDAPLSEVLRVAGETCRQMARDGVEEFRYMRVYFLSMMADAIKDVLWVLEKLLCV